MGHTQRLDFNAIKNQQSSPTVNSSTQPPQVSKPEPLEHFKSLNFLSNLLISSIDHVWLQFSLSVMSDSMQPNGLQHVRLPCPSPTPGACSSTCHPAISSSVVLFSSHLQSFPASGSFPVSQFFVSGGQSIGVSASASVLPMNIQD